MTSKNRTGESSVPEATTKLFCTNLSQGIHAAAQPLTILRASLGQDQTDRMSLGDFHVLAKRLAFEIERVCTCFNHLQHLVVTESTVPELSEMSILPILDHVTGGVNLLFEQDGIFLTSKVDDSCQPVLINRARTLQALSSVLLIAHGVSGFRDTVELIASPSISHGVQIIVRNVNSCIDAMKAEANLGMALAEANIRSQHAKLSWSLRPFIVQIELDGASYLH